MDKNIAIEFDGVGKQYRLGLVGTGSLQHDINRWWQTSILGKEDPYLKIGEVNDRSTKGHSDYVWALKDISFKVEQGDVVGIIGKNGAGKSTLLKLLSHITAPTVGHITYRGRIASLLEVGTGFHPEMTARDNIYMNGSIMGMGKHEIDRKLDEIIDFAGIERYIDTPVKRFSSGMTVRLGFAVAAFLEPDILVVDEVLAVGDAEFQKKAIGKMQEVSSSGGRTVLFVSHNMNAVRNLCKRGIVLNNGQIDFDGNVNDAVDKYMDRCDDIGTSDREIVDCIQTKSPQVKINRILFNGTSKNSTTIHMNQKYLDIVVEGEAKLPIKVDVSFTIRNMLNAPIAFFSEGHYCGIMEDIPSGPFVLKKRVVLPKYLSSGDCVASLGMHHPNVEVYFFASNCMRIHFEGNMGEIGRTFSIESSGLIGLESINSKQQ